MVLVQVVPEILRKTVGGHNAPPPPYGLGFNKGEHDSDKFMFYLTGFGHSFESRLEISAIARYLCLRGSV